jgi:hypothetical protein
MVRSNFMTIILATSVLALAPGSGPAMAGSGHGGGYGGGHGKSPGGVLLQKQGKSGGHGKPLFVSASHGKPIADGCVGTAETACDTELAEADPALNGYVASSLQGVNAAVHSSATALEHANENSMPGKARIFRDASLLSSKQDQLTLLSEERTVETIQAEIDALDPVVDAEKIATLKLEQDSARTDGQVGADINTVMGEIEQMQADQGDVQITSDQAYSDLTGGRTMVQEAYDVLISALGLN